MGLFDAAVTVNPMEAWTRGAQQANKLAAEQQDLDKGALQLQLLRNQMDMGKELAAVGMPAGTASAPNPTVPDAAAESAANETGGKTYKAPDSPIWAMDLKVAAEAKQRAQIRYKAGDYKGGDAENTLASQALGRAATAQQYAQEQKRKDYDAIENILANVTGPEDLQGALTALDKFRPGTIENNKFQRDPVTGKYLWDTTINPNVASNKQILEAMRKDTRVQKDLLEVQDKQSSIAHRKKLEEQADASLAERKREADMNDARARQGLEETRKAREERQGEREEARASRLTEKVQDRLDKAPEIKSFAQYQTGVTAANEIEKKLKQPNGFEQVTTVDARILYNHFYNMASDYRAGRVGGAYEAKQIAQLNGVFQKLEKYVQTLGEGDKLTDSKTMLEATAAMRGLYENKNVQVLKRELAAFDELKSKVDKVTISDLRRTGDLNAAVQAGKAKITVLNGKNYVLFGTGPSNQFELPPEK